MARSYGTIYVDIWDDDDFKALTDGAQRVYFMLFSQKDLRSTGIVSLSERRWASFASNTVRQDIEDHLKELEGARFIVVDEDTEEVLIRTFMRWDGGYRNTNQRKSIQSAYRVIHSTKLAAIVADEFQALTGSAITAEADSAKNHQYTGSDEGASEGPSEGSTQGVPEATYSPKPATSNPEPVTSNQQQQHVSAQHAPAEPAVVVPAAAAAGLEHQQAENDPAIAECIDLALRVRQSQSKSEIKSPARWAAKVRQGIATEHGEAFAAALAEGKDATGAVAGVLGMQRLEVVMAKQGGGYL